MIFFPTEFSSELQTCPCAKSEIKFTNSPTGNQVECSASHTELLKQ